MLGALLRLLRRLMNRRVPAGRTGDGPGGTAGVREPRKPRPDGPRADAAERPAPEADEYVTLSDPRR